MPKSELKKNSADHLTVPNTQVFPQEKRSGN